jgi:hypothetical protein
MKKILFFLGLFLITYVSSYSQLTINQSFSPSTNLHVGDTITVTYNVSGVSRARYVWLRYQYNTNALTMVANSTNFNQGNSSQTYYYEWTNYVYNAYSNTAVTDLYGQYNHNPWNYVAQSGNNVGQLSVQRTDKAITGTLATQKFVIKDLLSYNNIHKLDLSYALDSTDGSMITNITTNPGTISLGTVTGATSSFTVKVLYPTSYSYINKHNVQITKVNADGSPNLSQIITSGNLDASGTVTFTNGIKVGDSVAVVIKPAMQQTFMNNIVTVADAYKAFLGVSQVDLNGNQTYWTYPSFEKKVGMIGINDTSFSEKDSYYMFSYVMGQDMSSVANIPTSTASNPYFLSGLLNQSWLNGTPTYRVYVTSPNQTVNAVYAWGGDMAFNESPSPAAIATAIQNGNYTNSEKPVVSTDVVKTMLVNTSSIVRTMAYVAPPLDTASLNITSTIIEGKVVLTCGLTKANLAGLQVILNYDSTALSLDNVIFNAGNTVTNFSTHNNGRLTFGSIDQIKTARILTGIPYTLIFTPKVTLQNTAGLFFFVLADAVDSNGNKINLIVQ